MTDIVGNPEEERHADFYDQGWTQEAISRYFYGKVHYKENNKIHTNCFRHCPHYLNKSLDQNIFCISSNEYNFQFSW